MSLEARPVIPSPKERDCVYGEGHLCIKWLTVGAAQEEILEFMSCSCPRKFNGGKCCCIDNGMKCTDLCMIKCENMGNTLTLIITTIFSVVY